MSNVTLNVLCSDSFCSSHIIPYHPVYLKCFLTLFFIASWIISASSHEKVMRIFPVLFFVARKMSRHTIMWTIRYLWLSDGKGDVFLLEPSWAGNWRSWRWQKILIPDAPWCWYMYLHDWVIFGVNVGKYSSTMVRIWVYGKVPFRHGGTPSHHPSSNGIFHDFYQSARWVPPWLRAGKTPSGVNQWIFVSCTWYGQENCQEQYGCLLQWGVPLNHHPFFVGMFREININKPFIMGIIHFRQPPYLL